MCRSAGRVQPPPCRHAGEARYASVDCNVIMCVKCMCWMVRVTALRRGLGRRAGPPPGLGDRFKAVVPEPLGSA